MSVSLVELFNAVTAVTSRFTGREREVVAAFAALVSGEPAFFCGPPGTAKTAIVESVAQLCNARYFYYLLTRFTEPDELLGPVSIPALREGRWERVTEGRLPSAHIAFLDEVFKASSAVRNVLLDIILHRRFLNGGSYVKLPLLAVYTASNEVSHDAEDAAFYDRLLLRVFMRDLGEEMWDDLLARGAAITFDDAAPLQPMLSLSYIEQLQALARRRALEIASSPAWRERIVKALLSLKDRGVRLSDRRKVKLILAFSAISIVYAEQEPSPDSLGDALRLVAPREEGDLAKIEEVIVKENLSAFDLTEYLTAVEEAAKLVADLRQQVAAGTLSPSHLSALKEVRARLAKLYNSLPTTLRTFSVKSKLYAAIAEIDRIRRELLG